MTASETATKRTDLKRINKRARPAVFQIRSLSAHMRADIYCAGFFF